jgi:hypothetical protein
VRKRLVPLFFIFVLAAQVWAGVCGCFEDEKNSHSKMSCCKRAKSAQASVSAKPCCDTACGESTENKSPRLPSDSGMKIPTPVLAAVEKLIVSFDLKPNYSPLPKISKRGTVACSILTRPPDLYLQNHAFLI